MTTQKLRELNNAYDMLQGCINKLHTSDNKEEMARLFNSAIYYLNTITSIKSGVPNIEVNYQSLTIQECNKKLGLSSTGIESINYSMSLIRKLFELYISRVGELS